MGQTESLGVYTGISLPVQNPGRSLNLSRCRVRRSPTTEVLSANWGCVYCNPAGEGEQVFADLSLRDWEAHGSRAEYLPNPALRASASASDRVFTRASSSKSHQSLSPEFHEGLPHLSPDIPFHHIPLHTVRGPLFANPKKSCPRQRTSRAAQGPLADTSRWPSACSPCTSSSTLPRSRQGSRLDVVFNKGRFILIATCAAWAVMTGAGIRLLWNYENAPGPADRPLQLAFRQCRIRPATVPPPPIVHANHVWFTALPCTRASIGE